MATPFEYSRIHPMVLCISRSSDNTNHPKYSLSPFYSPFPVFFLGRVVCQIPTLLAPVLKLSRTRRSRASFVDQLPSNFCYRCPALRVSFVLFVSSRILDSAFLNVFGDFHSRESKHARGLTNGNAGKLLFSFPDFSLHRGCFFEV